jgi:hypothetical protein
VTRIRFTLNGNEFRLTDGEPGEGEVSRSSAEAWAAAGVPMEFVEDEPPAPRAKPRKRNP